MTIKSLYPTVRPTLNLNFARTKALDPRVTFTRASTATFVGSNGLIQTAASGAARFDHDPATGESLGLLVEEARTNLLTYSEQFDNAYWQNNANVTSNTDTAPDGNLTADTYSSTGAQLQTSFISITQNTNYTASLFIKKTTGRAYTAGFYLNYDGGTLYASLFNTNDGTFSAPTFASSPTVKSDDAGNYWRVSLTANSGSTVNVRFSLYPNLGTGGAVGTGQQVAWGAQLETGSSPTSYIPTSGSTVTRAADVATLANTGSSIFPTSAFTTVNSPFGTASGGSTVKLVGPTVKRTAVYNGDLTQTQINALAEVNDDFWRWRVLGSSFALPNFTTNGSVTVDWGDGVVETLTTAAHTFTNGGGYHDIGFRLNSGTFFKPNINNNATYKTRVIATGPAPASMKVDANLGFYGCSALRSFDATVDATGSTTFTNAWNDCNSLTSFPLINTAAGTIFSQAWYNCSSLTSFPLINIGAGTNFYNAWANCSSLTSFPLINTAAGTTFQSAWYACSGLTSFPLINTGAGTNFRSAWGNCSSLTSFPLINTAAGTTFQGAWGTCSSLTSFPLIDTAAGTNFSAAWYNCSSLTSFPLIDTAAGTNFSSAWIGCSSLTSFPLINTGAGTDFQEAWRNCSSLTSFPSIDTAAGTNFYRAWLSCANLSSFPLIDTAAGTNFQSTWQGLSLLTSFPLIDTGAGTNFRSAWFGCSGLTSFPLINTGAGTTFQDAWLGCSSLTSFPLINTGAGTNFQSAWESCTNLASFPLINTGAGTNFSRAWLSCTNLSSFPANMFNTTGTLVATAFTSAFQNCALTATSIENILTSLVTNGQSNITLSLHSGTNAGASTWTANAIAAYNTLISRGWTISRNA
jgi:hypothetical protein